jgi:hypothetical protein
MFPSSWQYPAPKAQAQPVPIAQPVPQNHMVYGHGQPHPQHRIVAVIHANPETEEKPIYVCAAERGGKKRDKFVLQMPGRRIGMESTGMRTKRHKEHETAQVLEGRNPLWVD